MFRPSLKNLCLLSRDLLPQNTTYPKYVMAVLDIAFFLIHLPMSHLSVHTWNTLCLYLESSYIPIQAETGDGSKKIN